MAETQRSPLEFIESFLATGPSLKHQHAPYDPVKSHAYYEAHKHLKGRQKGSGQAPTGNGGRHAPVAVRGNHSTAKTSTNHHGTVPPELEARIHHLEARLAVLVAHLQKLLASKARKAHHTGKTAASKSKAAAASKKYRQTHKAQLAAKAKAHAKARKSSGGSSAVSNMTEAQLRAAITTCRANLQAAIEKARAAVNR